MKDQAVMALEKIVKLCSDPDNITDRQLRVFDVALEGLGLCAGQRLHEVHAVIQTHRDRVMARREERAANGDDHAAA